jgi:hypothetical protein
MLIHCENVQTSKFWQKSKENNQFFKILTKAM